MQTETFENIQPEITQQEKEFLDLLAEIATCVILKGHSLIANREHNPEVPVDTKPASNQRR